MELKKGDRGIPLLDPDQYLLESKITGAAPYWFSAILADLKIQPVSFSKYGRSYTQMHTNEQITVLTEEYLPLKGENHVQQRISCRYI